MLDAHIQFPLIESFGDTVDVARTKLALAQADGSYPHVSRRRLGRGPTDTELAEAGWVIECSTTTARDAGTTCSAFYLHAAGDRCMHLDVRTGEASIMVAACSARDAVDATDTLAALCAEAETLADPDIVPMVFHWYSTGVCTRRRSVETQAFDAIRDNYAPGTRASLEQLHAYTPPDDPGAVQGRLLLFHGAPGTGKTTAVRSLARAWAPWCTATYIVDPEALFGAPEYLIEVAIDGGDRGRNVLRSLVDDDDDTALTAPAWKLVVVEDVDELLRADAKLRTGQALSRLLNMTDGLLGQGLRTMFLLTTNEPMSAVHPAVSRPGRCLANIEFAAFDRPEASAWLAARGLGPAHESATLAELFAAVRGGVVRSDVPRPANGAQATGQYL